MKHLLMDSEDKIERGQIWQQKGYYSTDCGEENDEREERKKGKEAGDAAGGEEEDDDDEDEYYYYDEEDEDEETKKEGAAEIDPLKVIEKEKEELKMPEVERKLVEQMSDIEKELIAKQDKKLAAKREEKKKPDYSWWHYDDPSTYFCISTQSHYTFKEG